MCACMQRECLIKKCVGAVALGPDELFPNGRSANGEERLHWRAARNFGYQSAGTIRWRSLDPRFISLAR